MLAITNMPLPRADLERGVTGYPAGRRKWMYPHPIRSALCVAGLLCLAMPVAQAAELVLSDDDCREVVEQWASDREAVAPAAVVEGCKEQLAADAGEAPDPQGPTIAALPDTDLNPCAGSSAADSVLCWGPWAALTPAAGPEPLPKAVASARPTEVVCRPELAGQCEPDLEAVSPPPIVTLPLGSCAPGAPCGFATLVAGVTSSAAPEETRFVRIALNPDGTAFVIDADDLAPIASVDGMAVIITPRSTDDYENLRANGSEGELQSRLVARVIRDEGGELLLAADVWGVGNTATGTASSGYFAWGVASGQAGLDSLNAGNVSLQFSGPMSVDNQTSAALRIDFGASPDWNGTWTHPAWSFSAGGSVSGADLISQPDQFSANVVGSDNVVQGALLGEPGQRALAHIIDVELADQGRIRDVGLLREALASPVLAPDPAP